MCIFGNNGTTRFMSERRDNILPFKVCKNIVMFKDHEVIREHLDRSGFMDNYFIWTKHCETQPGQKAS
jgi:hypothetical protein